MLVFVNTIMFTFYHSSIHLNFLIQWICPQLTLQMLTITVEISSISKTSYLISFCRTCQGHKRLPLSADYPNLCSTVEKVPNITSYCNRNNRWRPERLGNKTLSKEVEWEIYNYARYEAANKNSVHS